MVECLLNLSEGENLDGRTVGEFVLRERIGEGGYGAVYRCEQPQLGREAVVKVLHKRLRDDGVIQQRFMREAKLASRLDHPYAAHVYAPADRRACCPGRIGRGRTGHAGPARIAGA